MQLRTRLFLGFSIISSSLLLIGIFSISNTARAAEKANEVVRRIEIVQTLSELRSAADRTVQELLSTLSATSLLSLSGDNADFTDFLSGEIQQLAASRQEVADLLDAYDALHASEAGAPEIALNLRSSLEQIEAAGTTLLRALMNQDMEGIPAGLLELEDATEAFETAFSAAFEPQLARQNDLAEDVAQSAATGRIFSEVSYTILLVILATIGMTVARSVIRPAKRLQIAAEALLNGNYVHRALEEGPAELKRVAQTFNRMATAVQERDRSLTDLNTSLEERVEERTRELRFAMAQVEEASRLKSQFLANMSHELRTPLNAIIGFSGIIMGGMGGEIDDDARHMVSRIQANSSRLLDLIDSVLDLAKIEAGRIDIVYLPVSPRALAEQWKSETGVLAAKKNLTLEVTVDPDVPEQVEGDEDRLSQIANNLLSNAIKFTEQGGIKVHIGRSGDNWSIAVSDTGIGIPPHAINYIFDEFRQADGSTTRMYGGTGLGLSIVRRLVLMMRGNIRVVSEVGTGSTFTVTLPLKPVPVHAAEMASRG